MRKPCIPNAIKKRPKIVTAIYPISFSDVIYSTGHNEGPQNLPKPKPYAKLDDFSLRLCKRKYSSVWVLVFNILSGLDTFAQKHNKQQQTPILTLIIFMTVSNNLGRFLLLLNLVYYLCLDIAQCG